MLLGKEAMTKVGSILGRDSTILDIGSGVNSPVDAWFTEQGFIVDTVDFKGSPTYRGDYNQIDIGKEYDCVWACHCLEHQLNVNNFLKKVHSNIKEGGLCAITVPPLKHQIVSGHVSLWNAGLLLYNLVLANFDCSQAKVLKYDYNISVIVKKRTIQLPEDLTYNEGDLIRLEPYLPYKFLKKGPANSFNGDIRRLNW